LRILIASDAWTPQTNGVVVTLRNTVRTLEALGHSVEVIGPDRFRSIACPTYPEIRLALKPGSGIARTITEFAPDAIHLSTEGPIGMAARRICLRRGLTFTTAYHTRFPEYVHTRIRLPTAVTYAWLRRFHAASSCLMVATPAIEEDLSRRGFSRIARWTRGVDTALFRPGRAIPNNWTRPVFMYVGRVAVEKNISAFLDVDLPGTKVVVGDGPERRTLQQWHPEVVFTGAKYGEALAAHYRTADAFVFPSRTDTFGLVMLEAMASGTPVAAYRVPGPLDVVTEGKSGILGDDLQAAALAALDLDRETVRRHALDYSWEHATSQFVANLRANDVCLEAA
jgi:glycosyltransferase involved in cell wall biosynthesis